MISDQTRLNLRNNLYLDTTTLTVTLSTNCKSSRCAIANRLLVHLLLITHRLLIAEWLLVYRLLIAHRLLVHWLLIAHWLLVHWLLKADWLLVHWLLIAHWLLVYRLLIACWRSELNLNRRCSNMSSWNFCRNFEPI